MLLEIDFSTCLKKKYYSILDNSVILNQIVILFCFHFFLQGFINCHVRDAAALCSYFAWLEKQIPTGTVTEISGADKLASLRAEMEHFIGLSFDTISSIGPNGAIIHYKPSIDSNRTVTEEEVYLVDSGGQYKDGTTDVTRSMHFGTPKTFEKVRKPYFLKKRYAYTRNPWRGL